MRSGRWAGAREHRSDSLSAAFCNLDRDAQEDLTLAIRADAPLRHDTDPEQLGCRARERLHREFARPSQEDAGGRTAAAWQP